MTRCGPSSGAAGEWPWEEELMESWLVVDDYRMSSNSRSHAVLYPSSCDGRAHRRRCMKPRGRRRLERILHGVVSGVDQLPRGAERERWPVVHRWPDVQCGHMVALGLSCGPLWLGEDLYHATVDSHQSLPLPRSVFRVDYLAHIDRDDSPCTPADCFQQSDHRLQATVHQQIAISGGKWRKYQRQRSRRVHRIDELQCQLGAMSEPALVAIAQRHCIDANGAYQRRERSGRDYSLNQIAIVLTIIDGHLRHTGDHVCLDVTLEHRLFRHGKRIGFQVVDRRTHRPSRADQCTDAGSHNRIDLDSSFDQRTDHSDVRHPAHRAAAEYVDGVRSVEGVLGSGVFREWTGDWETRHLSCLIKRQKYRA